ncbi:MAG: bifunctional alpha/beta hydrolase/class I SAM-dependent methyltransferase [Burkholderiales bacterium]
MPPDSDAPHGAPARLRPVREGAFTTHDGVSLFYRHWPATLPRRGAILLLHRGHEHSGRMAHLVDELDLPAFDFYAWDSRGHGRSPGARGDAPSVGTIVRDLDTFSAHIARVHGVAVGDQAVVAQSVAAVVCAAWVHDVAPRLRAQVLASPAFDVRLYVPLARPGLALLRRWRGNFFVTSYVKAKLLTRDPARQAGYDADPLIAKSISVNILLGLHDTARRVVADSHAIVVPTQLLVSGADWVVKQAPQHAFFERLSSPVKERHVFETFLHDTLGERDRAPAVGRVRDFLLRAFDTPAAAPDLAGLDRAGVAHDEAAALARALPWWTPRGLYWTLARASIRLGASLSDGLRIGRETGHNSGSMLDYVYRDEASGAGPLGRLADRRYLDAPGWRGIRQRKAHLEELVRLAIGRLRAANRPVRLLDIAAGHGRYVLDAIAASPTRPDAIVLRDVEPRHVDAARALIRERRLADIARSETGDAFDRDALAAVSPRPTLAIVSGLYELFGDNAAVARSLAGLAAAIEPGGLLVYTNQPWHPQLELIARTLTHPDGSPWVMRRRTQAEMDALVRRAGFEKEATRVDEGGLFTVSLARRVDAAGPDS